MTFEPGRLLLFAFLALVACAPVPGARAPDAALQSAPSPEGRHAVTWLPLTEAGPAEGQARGYFDADGAGRVSLVFLAHGPMHYAVTATCDGRARVRYPEGETTTPAWVAAGAPVALRIEPGERMRTWLEIDPATQACDLRVTPGGRPGWSLHLDRQDSALPRIAALDAPLAACSGGGADRLERAFMASAGLSATCPVPMGRYEMLPDGVDALNARVAALTGRPLSRAAIEAGDPAMPLDYSAAPQLDLIYVTYLNLNADFAGYLMARMLAWHAARGTIVRILVSDIMLTGTDRRLFEGLAARYPTVQLQPYRMPARLAEGFEGQFARLHRVTHVKLFATMAREPGRSVAMVGGRNIHEGYFLPTPRDLADFPFLHQYDPAQTRLTGGFTSYQDFELALHGDAAVRQIVQHMAALWHRDYDTQRLRPASGGATPVADVPEGSARHFISVPFNDGTAQEAYYAGLIDAAQHNIRIASPYLNLPPLLDAALRRALARGVQVDVVVTVRVREATDFMVTGLNREFANLFGDRVHLYDYDPIPLLLHAKLVVIDDRLVVIGSTNLNQRSFLHDLENGVIALDRGLATRVDALIQQYIDQGERVMPGQYLSRWMRLLARFGVFRRAF